MTTNNEIRLRNDMRVFKSVNHNQHSQYMLDQFKHISDSIDGYVKIYNENRLPDEPEITRQEMINELSRKG